MDKKGGGSVIASDSLEDEVCGENKIKKSCFIEFKWTPEFKDMAQCDALHLLYLVQRAIEFYGDDLNERNKYFDSISRSDRIRDHVDTPRFINNVIEWLNADKESNLFNGEIFEKESALFLVNLMAKIGAFSVVIIPKSI